MPVQAVRRSPAWFTTRARIRAARATLPRMLDAVGAGLAFAAYLVGGLLLGGAS